MGDVHGRKRERTTEELLKIRKEKEAGKITEYNELVKQCQQRMKDKIYDQETFNLTTKIVNWNPDFYTIWNYRRQVLLNSILKPDEEEENQKVFQKELMLFMQLIKLNPKSYWLWNHRFWCLQNMPHPDWDNELALVDKMLSLDARNFHGWDYRRYVLSHLRKINNSNEDVYKLAVSEYDFTTKKINQSFSNYSSWHQRSKLLPEIVAPKRAEEKNEIARRELDLVKNAIYTDPDDQSAWLYYWWILGNAPEPVELLGAYHLKDTRFVILAFNDIVRLTQKPSVLKEQGDLLDGNLYPIPEKNKRKDSASIWIYVLSEDDLVVDRVSISSSSILPSSSGRRALDKSWDIQIQSVEKDKAICESMSTLVSTLEKSAWTPSFARMYKDPTIEAQSDWFTLDKVQLLREEIDTVRELLEIEPTSAWALQTLVHFLSQLCLRANDVNKNEIYEEIISILDTLKDLDKDRRNRYEDQKTWFVFQKITQNIPGSSDGPLDLTVLNDIPLLSKLLFVSKVIVSSQKVQSMLLHLPFLEECIMKV
ncbi:hypothetical protein G6F70_003372 [Rhizopus microsporus]|uniref:Geranylgeranyl transferase type-2 subunit alpha n=2 Tax=Rhizopus TaxID=4842 RepID=A0A367JU77_RHIAZ|nr:hypothetical protein G6F71_003174 [Rhizopus microsporus]RCH93468.1 hypothetical protein CU097_012642 [Rhizopus azygosporus]KAG1201211.1 hypothetical protein G6F70_003372 [Rhizopus microsporus]KAG1213321.1 hypothetical protein G6F69_002930 [Rhizopus microsporus]KAG1235318.1 hypothetical protein G6F67_002846 [Rhizopus microsporus]